MDRSPPCTVCGSTGAVGFLLRKNGYDLFRCDTCDHIFVDPFPGEDELAALYSFDSGYQVQEMQRFDRLDRFPPKLVRSLATLRSSVPGGRLLDVGCSTGMFLYLARQAGYEAVGVELNKDTAAIARANGLDVVVGTLADAGFEPGSFDVIHMGDLIEHVRDPAALLRDARQLLSEGGTLLVLTPNHDAYFPRATYRLFRRFGIPWSHPTPPLHLNQFSRSSLGRLLEQNGFVVREEHYAPCSLKYELRATGVFSRLKRLVRERRFVRAGVQSLGCLLVAKLYIGVWLLDRLRGSKQRDFAMTLLAAPGARS